MFSENSTSSRLNVNRGDGFTKATWEFISESDEQKSRNTRCLVATLRGLVQVSFLSRKKRDEMATYDFPGTLSFNP